MPRKSKGPYLYYHRQIDRWVVRHKRRMISTGFSHDFKGDAEKYLEQYIRDGGIRENDEHVGFIYFISTDAVGYPIKIGYSHQAVSARLSQMQSHHPELMVILGTMPGGPDHEHSLHRRFRKYHIRGEWFVRHGKLMQYIQNNCLNARSSEDEIEERYAREAS